MSAAAKPIDYDHLDRYTAGDVTLMREVLRLFRAQGDQLIETMSAADDLKTWKITAHGLKGAARGIGAWEMAKAAAEAELVEFASISARFAALGALTIAFEAVAKEIDAEADQG
jgi:HPt (histidine-containing phosphotransfer) domain-containing protein